jgi:hypothetical protein
VQLKIDGTADGEKDECGGFAPEIPIVFAADFISQQSIFF